MQPRVVVTGIGAVTAAGVGVPALAQALRQGHSLAGRLTDEGEGEHPDCRIGARARGFDALDFLDHREARGLGLAAQLFVAAGSLALKDSGVGTSRLARDRVGVFEGTSLGGLGRGLEEHRRWLARGRHGLHPRAATAAMTGAGGGALAAIHGIHGPVLALSNGSASAACAIAVAMDQIRLGEIDVAVVGAGEAPLEPPILALLSRAGLLSHHHADPEHACRPFDAARDGTVLSEAGAAVVLESLACAERRGARIAAELCGAAITNDAGASVAPEPSGAERARGMRLALTKARVDPAEIDYVSAHATATRANDVAETRAIKQALGPRAYRVPVGAPKSILCHALGACTALELAALVVAMEGGFLPPTANLTTPDPECDLDYVPNRPREGAIHLALVNSCSFGGRNASLVVGAWDSARSPAPD